MNKTGTIISITTLPVLLSGCLLGYFQASEHSKKVGKLKISEKVKIIAPTIYEPLRTSQAISVRLEGDHDQLVLQSFTDHLAGYHQIISDDPVSDGAVELEGALRYSYNPVAARVSDGRTVEGCVVTLAMTGSQDGQPIFSALPEAQGTYDVAIGASPQGEGPTCRLAATNLGKLLATHLGPHEYETVLQTHDLDNKAANEETARARRLFGEGKLAESGEVLAELAERGGDGSDAGWAHFNHGRYLQVMRRFADCASALERSARTLPPETSKEFGIAEAASECEQAAKMWFR